MFKADVTYPVRTESGVEEFTKTLDEYSRENLEDTLIWAEWWVLMYGADEVNDQVITVKDETGETVARLNKWSTELCLD